MATSLGYSDLDYRLSSYRTDAGAEVDIILEIEDRIIAIEVKSSIFKNSELGGLGSFKKFVGKKVESFVVIPEGPARVVEGIHVMPWQQFLKLLKI